MQYACKKVRERLRTATKQILPSSYSPSSKTTWSKVTTLKDLKTMHRRQHLYSRSTCFSTFSLSTGVYNYSLTVAPASAPIHFNTGSACHTAPQCSSYARIQFFLQYIVCCKTGTSSHQLLGRSVEDWKIFIPHTPSIDLSVHSTLVSYVWSYCIHTQDLNKYMS